MFFVSDNHPQILKYIVLPRPRLHSEVWLSLPIVLHVDADAGNLELGGGWAGSPIELQGQGGTQAGGLGPVIHS